MTGHPTQDWLTRFERDLGQCLTVDAPGLRKSLHRLRREIAADRDVAASIARLETAIAQSCARRASRQVRLPRPTFPASLPVAGRRQEIADAIAAHPVVIVCGETGSGKTTQLPKICLSIGRGVAGLIGHTQPRRIAARTVAARIAQELGTPLGAAVGYKVRFHDQVGADAYVKLMTDGILLAETQGDRLLAAYDTLIVDEAHERSLNIDFLLGYLHQLLPRRPDLKLIITSATIDAERFARHFGGAPVIEVTGRLHPVEVRWRPPRREADEDPDDEPRELPAHVVDAVAEACRAGPGDILVFLPGEREIRDCAEALRKNGPPGAEILPLYARLSAAEQARVFEPSRGRRIVLATNVAETSLTVPGIRFVVDSGLARINRYSLRNKVEQLLTERISQASADQRAGRCGRVAAGICIRLYEQEDHAARPRFGEPEILRSSLAGVILRMKALELGAVERFPFVDPPSPRMIADGYQLLGELGAVDDGRLITPLGRELARLPVDPRLGRMILAGRDGACLAEVLVLAAALSVQDPRERPLERAQAADERHAVFRDERSDFSALLALWGFYDQRLKHMKSRRSLERELREAFLSPLRLREWREVHGQLHALVTEMGMRPNDQPASWEAVHRALLPGLLGNVGMKSEEGDYQGVRGIRFAVHPGSGLRKRQPRWLVAAELVETARLYARTVAQIEPEWIEAAAAHLVRRSYHEPRWDGGTARVVAWEQVTLYGLVLVARRTVHYGPIDPARARSIFLRAGLVEGGYAPDVPFLRHNQRLRREIEALEDKSRRRDVLVDEDAMVAFYDARVPQGIHNGAGFEAWRREVESTDPRCLFMRREDLMRHAGSGVTGALYPERIESGAGAVRLRYRFDPGHPLDGVTATLPLALLNAVEPARFDWLVPGLLRDKVNVLVRALPKTLRRACVPLPETVTACLERLEGVDPAVPLAHALRAALAATRGIDAPAEVWEGVEMPAHLTMAYRVVDDGGNEIASGRDLAALRRELGAAAEASFAPASVWERSGLTRWPDDLTLPESVEFTRERRKLTGYPALVDEQQSVRLTLMETPSRARAATRAGVLRLARFELREQVRALERALTPSKALAISWSPLGPAAALTESLIGASLERAVWADETPVRDRPAFEARMKHVRARLQVVAQEYLRLTEQVLAIWQRVRALLAGGAVRAFRSSAADMQRQLDELVHARFLAATPWSALASYPRYLQAIERRIAKLPERGERDAQHVRLLGEWRVRLDERRARDHKAGIDDPRVDAFRWMLEEQRVSLFAQELRTPYPVSWKRLDKAWAELATASSGGAAG